ncbi:NAD(P)(+) transhydrogenase (Re/Si-specific) subunit beta [Candidatus Bathyarchaeota archaeon]|nr:NAD(P)(+) transhydrogenase (Re/Si-specific) subunit beta [Candidatus Bathyarchaeota archaeon]
MNMTLIESVVYLATAIMVLIGLRMLSSPKTALWGNRIAALGMTAAILTTLIRYKIFDPVLVYPAIVIGSAIGVWLSRKIKMTEVPTLVSSFNGFGAGASAFIPIMEIINAYSTSSYPEMSLFWKTTSVLGIVVGVLTLGGSAIAALKLHGAIKQKPMQLPQHSVITYALLIVIGILGYFAVQSSNTMAIPWAIVIAIVSLIYGILLLIRVGGADMPVMIAFLNSLHGMAAAIVGFVVQNNLLIAIGAIVAASGYILTRIMCKAMNRSLLSVLKGKILTAAPTQTAKKVIEVAAEKPTRDPIEIAQEILREAKKVIIVPGYGMAASQCQEPVKRLLDLLEQRGVEVKFAIHPVAGRMPGHMNVILSEVDVPYDKLFEMAAINPEFPQTDAAMVVGANDVVNPAAQTASGTPIYGMPILEAYKAKNVLVFKRSKAAGYAGVENPLFEMKNTTMVYGDALKILNLLIEKLGTN